MVNIRAQHQRTSSGSPRAGEIDTRAPFQSVRAAVSLFGAVASKGKASFPSFKRQSSTTSSSESAKGSAVSEKETRLMLAAKDLSKYKAKLESADATKARALADLENSRQTLEELNMKIMIVKESKQSVLEATEALRHQAMELEEEMSREDVTAHGAWKDELEQAQEQYAIVAKELDSAKHSLSKIRQDFETAMEAKQAAIQQAAEAQSTSQVHRDKANELKKEIATMHESIEHLKFETQKSSKMKAKIVAERESLLQSYKPAKEEAERKQKALKKEFNPELTKILEQQYAETTAEIQEVKDKMRMLHSSEVHSVKDITEELNKATKTLQEVSAEESELRASLASLRMELEKAQKECAEAEEREKEMESLAVNLQQQVEACKAELEGLADFHTDELFSRLHKLLSGINAEKRAVEETKKSIEELKKDTEDANNAKQEAEKKLQDAVAELEEAKEGEKNANEELRNVSTVCGTDFGPGGAKIRMSNKDYETLKRKHDEADNVAEMKVAAMMFQVGAISAKKNEACMQLENTLKEIDRMQAVIDFALKQAEASESAQKAIEAELHRWRKE